MDMESDEIHGSCENNNNNNNNEEEDDDDEKNEVLKRKISTHPLYELLVQAHLECLKVGEISNVEKEQKMMNQKQAVRNQNMGMLSESELDVFMEAYCMALGKLKEAMEEPQQKSMAFINNMHSQLKELNRTSFHDQPTSSHSKFQTDSSI